MPPEPSNSSGMKTFSHHLGRTNFLIEVESTMSQFALIIWAYSPERATALALVAFFVLRPGFSLIRLPVPARLPGQTDHDAQRLYGIGYPGDFISLHHRQPANLAPLCDQRLCRLLPGIPVAKLTGNHLHAHPKNDTRASRMMSSLCSSRHLAPIFGSRPAQANRHRQHRWSTWSPWSSPLQRCSSVASSAGEQSRPPENQTPSGRIHVWLQIHLPAPQPVLAADDFSSATLYVTLGGVLVSTLILASTDQNTPPQHHAIRPGQLAVLLAAS